MNGKEIFTRARSIVTGELYTEGKLTELRAKIAASLPIDTWEKDPAELEQIASDPSQLPWLIDEARKDADAGKTLANRAIFPQVTIALLSETVRVIDVIFRNEVVQSLADDSQKGEMARDMVKVADAAANLEGPSGAQELRNKGSEMMEAMIAQLPEGDNTKNLMIIERQLRKEDVGEKPDWDVVSEHFDRLVEQEKKSNPHRVATVAMWLAARGRDDMGARAIFEDVMREHPDYDLSIEAEKKRGILKFVKQHLFWIPAMFTTSPKDRAELREKIMEW